MSNTMILKYWENFDLADHANKRACISYVILPFKKCIKTACTLFFTNFVLGSCAYLKLYVMYYVQYKLVSNFVTGTRRYYLMIWLNWILGCSVKLSFVQLE